MGAKELLVNEIVLGMTRLGEVVSIKDKEALLKLSIPDVVQEAGLIKDAVALHTTIAQFDFLFEMFNRERQRLDNLEEYQV